MYGEITSDCSKVGGHFVNYKDGVMVDLDSIPGGSAIAPTDTKSDANATLFGEDNILGKSIVVHASVAVENSFPKAACCLIQSIDPDTILNKELDDPSNEDEDEE